MTRFNRMGQNPYTEFRILPKGLIANQPLLSCQRWGLLLELELLPLLLHVNNQLFHLKVCKSAMERFLAQIKATDA